MNKLFSMPLFNHGNDLLSTMYEKSSTGHLLHLKYYLILALDLYFCSHGRRKKIKNKFPKQVTLIALLDLTTFMVIKIVFYNHNSFTP